MSSSLPCIGQTVRVRLQRGAGTGCCRATVSYVDAAEGTVDVVYEDGAEWAGGLEEEGGVALGRLLPLQPFEERNEQAAAADAGTLREEANVLFRTGDLGAALNRYRLALRQLLQLPEEESEVGGDRAGEGGCCVGLRVGATVLVHAAPDPSAGTSHVSSKRAGKLLSRVRRATVADVDLGKRTVDVIYDDEEDEGGDEERQEEEEEEDGVMMSRVVPLAGGSAAAQAQVEEGRLLLNISRVYLKSPLGRLHEALRAASLAAAALDGVACGDDGEGAGTEMEEAVRLLLSAHEVCVGALCRGGFFSAAKDDVRRLVRLPKRVKAGGVTGLGDRVKKLWAEIEQAGVERQRDNKRLAKSVSRWLHDAMAAGQQQEQEGGGEGPGVGAAGGGGQQQQEEAGCVCS